MGWRLNPKDSKRLDDMIAKKVKPSKIVVEKEVVDAIITHGQSLKKFEKVEDPEFEAKHPRDAGGRFAPKGKSRGLGESGEAAAPILRGDVKLSEEGDVPGKYDATKRALVGGLTGALVGAAVLKLPRDVREAVAGVGGMLIGSKFGRAAVTAGITVGGLLTQAFIEDRMRRAGEAPESTTARPTTSFTITEEDDEKMVKADADKDAAGTDIKAGDHVLIDHKKGSALGVYVGNDVVRLLGADQLIDTKVPEKKRLLVIPGNFVPNADSSPEKLEVLAEDLMEEREEVQRNVEDTEKLAKGISHATETLTELLDYVKGQQAKKELSEAEVREVDDIIEEVNGLVSYLEEVRDQGYFEE